MRRRAIEAVLNEILGLHSKPKAVVHSVYKLTGPKKKKKKKKKKKYSCMFSGTLETAHCRGQLGSLQ